MDPISYCLRWPGLVVQAASTRCLKRFRQERVAPWAPHTTSSTTPHRRMHLNWGRRVISLPSFSDWEVGRQGSINTLCKHSKVGWSFNLLTWTTSCNLPPLNPGIVKLYYTCASLDVQCACTLVTVERKS